MMSSSPPIISPVPGTLLHQRYRVVRLLGKGGAGAVYLAQDIRVDNRLVAVKTIPWGPQPYYQRRATLFDKEAALLSTLDHANLPRIYDAFRELSTLSGRLGLVMEFIDGESLAQKMQRAPAGLPEADVLEWMIRVCDTLAYLHERKPPVIFRDVKPANIMLARGGEIKLIDFGLAEAVMAQQEDLTSGKSAPGPRAGTAGYAAPEQYAAGRASIPADLYSLGATIYALLTGQAPSQAMHQFLPLRQFRRDVAPEVEALVARLLSVEPLERPISARQVREILAQVLAERWAQFCTRCGRRNRLTSRFCQHCGAGLSTAAALQPLGQLAWQLKAGKQGATDTLAGFLPGNPLVSTLARHPVSQPGSGGLINRLYLGSNTGVLSCLEAETGRILWQGNCEGQPVTATPVWGMYHLYVVAGENLWAFDHDGGKPVWMLGFSSLLSGPMAWEGLVLMGTRSGTLFALDGRERHEVYRYRTGGWVEAAPLLAPNGRVAYLVATDGSVHAIVPQDGRRLWFRQLQGRLVRPPLATQNHLFIGGDTGALYALRASDGQVLWSNTTPSRQVLCGPGAFDGTYIYVASGQTVMALQPGDGRLIWQTQLPGRVSTGPLVVDSQVIVACDDGMLWGIDRTSGQLRSQFNLERRIEAPLSSYGRFILAASVKSEFFAIQI
ncbi:MAG: zinc-ribbon domain-containing protein [Chloroflexi bacterium]|nr:zinc-ribbon domain-containing protein [Chloroflexota bacterium]